MQSNLSFLWYKNPLFTVACRMFCVDISRDIVIAVRISRRVVAVQNEI